MAALISTYLTYLHNVATGTLATDKSGGRLPLQRAIEQGIALAQRAVDAGGKLMIIGNGGSAAIASHLAIDFTKNASLRALSFNDGAALTCLGNDFDFEYIFAKQIEAHARDGDVLVAISSSGKSKNIIRAVDAARARNSAVITLSGFKPDNPLRVLGDVNFYVDSAVYGFVEIAHLSLCHAMIDMKMGWQPS